MSKAYRYQTRSPRYVLKLSDRSTLRFAMMETRGICTPSTVLNLSRTGLAFEFKGSPTADLPVEGEIIKIEFEIPGLKQVACFATVTRTVTRTVARVDKTHDQMGTSENITHTIGVLFRNLPTAFTRILDEGLLRLIPSQNTRDAIAGGYVANATPTEILHFIFLSTGVLAGLCLLALPTQSWLLVVKTLL